MAFFAIFFVSKIEKKNTHTNIHKYTGDVLWCCFHVEFSEKEWGYRSVVGGRGYKVLDHFVDVMWLRLCTRWLRRWGIEKRIVQIYTIAPRVYSRHGTSALVVRRIRSSLLESSILMYLRYENRTGMKVFAILFTACGLIEGIKCKFPLGIDGLRKETI